MLLRVPQLSYPSVGMWINLLLTTLFPGFRSAIGCWPTRISKGGGRFRVSGVVKLSRGPHREGNCGVWIFAGAVLLWRPPSRQVDHRPARSGKDENGHHGVAVKKTPTEAAERQVVFFREPRRKKYLELSTVRRTGTGAKRAGKHSVRSRNNCRRAKAMVLAIREDDRLCPRRDLSLVPLGSDLRAQVSYAEVDMDPERTVMVACIWTLRIPARWSVLYIS